MQLDRKTVSTDYRSVNKCACPISALFSVAIPDHGRLRSLPNASRTFFTKWRTDKVFRIRCKRTYFLNNQFDHVTLYLSQSHAWQFRRFSSPKDSLFVFSQKTNLGAIEPT